MPKLWQVLLVSLGLSLGACLLRLLCWYDGTQGRYGLLLLCNILRFPLLFFAFALLPGSLGLDKNDGPIGPKGIKVYTLAGLLLILLACAGSYPFVLIVFAADVILVAAFIERRKDLLATAGKSVILRAVITGAAFLFTWYQCASTTASALQGLGERIEATGGSDRLKAWAAEEIAATPAGEMRTLSREEIPDFVDDIMGRIRGFPIRVFNGPEPEVTVANGSGYGYGVRICPAQEEEEPPHWYDAKFTWKPGIYLYTVSK